MNTSKILALFSFPLLLSLAIPPVFCDTKDDIRNHIKFGIRAAKDDHWDEAVYRWRKTLQLDPNNVMAHNNLAVAYEHLGDYDLAMEEYEIAYRLDSQNQMIQVNLDRFKDFYRKYQRQKG